MNFIITGHIMNNFFALPSSSSHSSKFLTQSRTLWCKYVSCNTSLPILPFKDSLFKVQVTSVQCSLLFMTQCWGAYLQILFKSTSTTRSWWFIQHWLIEPYFILSALANIKPTNPISHLQPCVWQTDSQVGEHSRPLQIWSHTWALSWIIPH